MIPWARLTALIEPVYRKVGNGRRSYRLERMLRIHFMQQCFALSDPVMEEALYNSMSMRQFSGANVHYVTQAGELLHGQESAVFGDSGYTGAGTREENKTRIVDWHIAAKPSAVRRLDPVLQTQAKYVETLKASMRGKVEHPFRVIKRQFGHVKVRYRGLAKNTAQLFTLFALANLWMARKPLMRTTAELRP